MSVGVINEAEAQKSSFSDYKSHTTVKYLVAIDAFTGVFTLCPWGFLETVWQIYSWTQWTTIYIFQSGHRILADKVYTAWVLFAMN